MCVPVAISIFTIQEKKPKRRETKSFTFEVSSPAKGVSPPQLPVAQSTPVVDNEVAVTEPADPTDSSPEDGQDVAITESTSMNSVTSVSSTSDDIVLPHPSPEVKILLNVDSYDRADPPSNSAAVNDNNVHTSGLSHKVC